MSEQQRKAFPFSEFEPKWQDEWEAKKAFHTPNPGDADFDATKPKYFVLDMFPYPSGAGLHVGHPEGYTATDIIGRFKKMSGFNVLHPMGWDAFGLPAEQYAIKTGQHPRITTEQNIEGFRGQLKRLGFAYDWDREVNTTDPGYFKWTQWIFLKLYNAYVNEEGKARPISELEAQGLSRAEIDSRRLAYISEAPVNWCPELGTVLANEEVVDGKSEVGGFAVERRPMRQWMLRITAFAQRLIDELDGLDWPESIRLLQRNWIGRSEGALVQFSVLSSQSSVPQSSITVFTTRPDTLFGATYMVIAPEHSLVDQIAAPEQAAAIAAYRRVVGSKSDLERTELAKEKTGVFTGAYAINPVNNEQIPIWIADYVMMGYGTGAIMAVPAHDERDFEFAKKFNLAVRQVVQEPRSKAFQALSPAPVHKHQGENTLPHWETDNAIYAVTFRLNDSVPKEVRETWDAEREDLRLKSESGSISGEEANRLTWLHSEKVEAWLDAGHGSCVFRDPGCAQLMADVLKHFDGQRYRLDAWCVMPNHVHAVVMPHAGHSLSDIVHSWKSYSAQQLNQRLKTALTLPTTVVFEYGCAR